MEFPKGNETPRDALLPQQNGESRMEFFPADPGLHTILYTILWSPWNS